MRNVMITLRRLFVRVFNPWLYWKHQYEDAMVTTYHPEIGSYWHPKEAGGLYIQQAHDQGYSQGCKDTAKDFYNRLLDNKYVQWEYRICTVRGSDTETHRVLQFLKGFGADGWEVFFMETVHRFKPMGVATDAADELNMYMRREKSDQKPIRREAHAYTEREFGSGCQRCGLGPGAYVHNLADNQEIDPTKAHRFQSQPRDSRYCLYCDGLSGAVIHDEAFIK